MVIPTYYGLMLDSIKFDLPRLYLNGNRLPYFRIAPQDMRREGARTCNRHFDGANHGLVIEGNWLAGVLIEQIV